MVEQKELDAGLCGTADPLLAPFEWRGMRFEFDGNWQGAPTAFAMPQDHAMVLGGNLRVIDWRNHYQRNFAASAGGPAYGTGSTPLEALEAWRKMKLDHAVAVVELLIDRTDLGEIEARPRE